jgi:NhaA family Na+:H+ antiporter
MAGVALGLAVPSRARRAAGEILDELSAHLERVRRKPSEEDLAAADLLMIEENIEALEAPASRFIHALHPLVAFVIMPLFAFVNSGVSVRGMTLGDLLSPVTVGCAAGLFIGKQLGIFALTFSAVRLGWAPMPTQTSASKLYGASIVAGIGFTVSLFIATLAFSHPSLLA